MLSRMSPYWMPVCLARIVMPFSRSRSPESITRSAMTWWAWNAPVCLRMASTRVVLPWSTWATMARSRGRSGRRSGAVRSWGSFRARRRWLSRSWADTCSHTGAAAGARYPQGASHSGGQDERAAPRPRQEPSADRSSPGCRRPGAAAVRHPGAARGHAPDPATELGGDARAVGLPVPGLLPSWVSRWARPGCGG